MGSINVQNIFHRAAQVRVTDQSNQGRVGAANAPEMLQALAPSPLGDQGQTEVELSVFVWPTVESGAEGCLGAPEILPHESRSTDGSPEGRRMTWQLVDAGENRGLHSCSALGAYRGS